jgi:hypothetical protein
MTMDLPQVPRCIHLHAKAMAIHGEGFADDTDHPDGPSGCWCIQTGRALGPDNGLVGLKMCSDPERECYQDY